MGVQRAIFWLRLFGIGVILAITPFVTGGAWSTVVVRTRPAGPGKMSRNVRTITVPMSPCPNALANPTSAIVHWSTTSPPR